MKTDSGPDIRRWTPLAWVVVAVWGGFVAVAGRFNDGGWYLCAARAVLRGEMPYRDFLFPQPPLSLSPYALTAAVAGESLLVARLTSVLLAAAALLVTMSVCRSVAGPVAAALAAVLFAANPWVLYYLCIVKTYALCSLLLAVTMWLLLAPPGPRPALAGICVALGCCSRLTFVFALPACVWLLAWRGGRGAAAVFLVLWAEVCIAVMTFFWLASDGRVLDNLYLPAPLVANDITRYYIERHVNYSLPLHLYKQFSSLGNSILDHYLALTAIVAGWRWGRKPGTGSEAWQATCVKFLMALVAGSVLVHLLPRRPYPEYNALVWPALCAAAACLLAPSWAAVAAGMRRHRWLAAACLLPSLVAAERGVSRLDFSGGAPALIELRQAAAVVRRNSRPGDRLLSLEPYLSYESGRELVRGATLGKYAYHPEWSDAECRRHHVVNDALLLRAAEDPRVTVAALAPAYFAVADPSQPERARLAFDRLVDRFGGVPVGRLPLFGYERDTLQILTRPDRIN